MSQIVFVDEKQVKCELIVVQSKLVAVVYEAQRAPYAHNLVAKEMLLYLLLILVRPNGDVNVLCVRYDAFSLG